MTNHERQCGTTFLSGRASRAGRILFGVWIAGLTWGSLLQASGFEEFDDTNYIKEFDERDRGVGWNMAVAGGGGTTDMGKGYSGYKNLGMSSLDFYFRPPIPQFPEWPDRMTFRFSGNYFPLQVPKNVYNTKEELYTVSGTVLYRFVNFGGLVPEHKKWIPFFGAGPALQWDRVIADSPVIKKSGSYLHLGATGSAGIMLPTVWRLRLIPEVRFFTFKTPDSYWTSYTAYMVSLAYWPPANVEE